MKDYIALTKPRITWLILMSTGVGYFFGLPDGLHAFSFGFGAWLKLFHTILGTGIVDHHNVGVIERRCRSPFLLKPADAIGVAGECRGENLERNVATQP